MWRTCRIRSFIAVFVATILCAGLLVQSANAQTTSWQGLNWGIGVAADFDVGGKRVSKVTLDNANIVRVTDTSGNVGVSFVLEAHYFVKEWFPQATCRGFNCTEYALGPFVAIEVAGGATATASNGVAANRPPPAGITTTDLLTKKEPRYGIMQLSSFSF
jgi:hypothetical protein